MNRIERTTKTITNTVLLNTICLLAQLKKLHNTKNNETRNNLLDNRQHSFKINIHSLNGIINFLFFSLSSRVSTLQRMHELK